MGGLGVVLSAIGRICIFGIFIIVCVCFHLVERSFLGIIKYM